MYGSRPDCLQTNWRVSINDQAVSGVVRAVL
jgi:hypothetical protein